MKREIFTTEDGSSSLFIPELNEQYHSKHGAIQEAQHVYLKSGLIYFTERFLPTTTINVLEIGLGTGLDALLTAELADCKRQSIAYTGLEAYPVKQKEWEMLNYPEQLSWGKAAEVFSRIHQSPWEETTALTDYFSLYKRQMRFEDFSDRETYHVIYFDAFGAQVQPELWEERIFKAMYDSLKSQSVLVTYSAKGSVKRALKAVGFEVEKIPGPPGKREMLRAVKL